MDAHLGDGCWFSGLVLRRSDGSTVGVVTRSHSDLETAIYGESMALSDAIDFVEKLQLKSVIFELDSQVVVNAVRSKASIRKP
ncbi:hypothetical protein A2U01_0000884 [Trifolium medium]|uniref:RNase H type-1 domain-containing protein n=1 Tax=Trifolium medium TaxID=97028 RepID=A0A392LYQ6_9FABA|nr:hypothetical protein [Trifolium medium]